jgi:hypothetical protein
MTTASICEWRHAAGWDWGNREQDRGEGRARHYLTWLCVTVPRWYTLICRNTAVGHHASSQHGLRESSCAMGGGRCSYAVLASTTCCHADHVHVFLLLPLPPGTRLSRSWALRSSPSLPTLRRSCTASKALVARHTGPALLQPGATPWQPCHQGWTPVFVRPSRPPDTWPAAARAPQAGRRGPAAAPCALLRAPGGAHRATHKQGERAGAMHPAAWQGLCCGCLSSCTAAPGARLTGHPWQAGVPAGCGLRAPGCCWSGMRASPFIV